MQNKRFDKRSLIAGLMLAAVAILNTVSLFFLPQTFSAAVSAQRVSSLSFAVGGILLVGVSGLMAVFGPKPKKWIAMQAVLTAADVLLVVYNLATQ